MRVTVDCSRNRLCEMQLAVKTEISSFTRDGGGTLFGVLDIDNRSFDMVFGHRITE